MKFTKSFDYKLAGEDTDCEIDHFSTFRPPWPWPGTRSYV